MEHAPKLTIEQLRHVALNFPVIDSHAHNLILPTHADTVPFESITSEAQGRALKDTFKSLAHLRAATQLRELYELDENANWADILEQREEWLHSDPERFTQRCFNGIAAILIDDGLASAGKVHPYDWHDRYTDAPSKRLVRIETVAERLMEAIVKDADEDDLGKTSFYTETWVSFMDDFERKIQEAIDDPEVAGFKTVICYRTGLDIEEDYERAAKAVGYPFERYVKHCVRKRSFRIERKSLNDYLVLRTLEILSDNMPRSDEFSKPLQLHAGLGDNDIDLSLSNPAFLQPLIENYPNVPFVILQSAYPYTREAGYLAKVYKHVYLDIGEVFPMLSRDGQKAVLRQALELVPGGKLLYSSDGRWFPETFWLANKQFREVWLELLIEYVDKADLTPHQAIGMTKDVLFNNVNTLYNLRYEPIFSEMPQEVPKQLTFNQKTAQEHQPQPPVPIPMPSPGVAATLSDREVLPEHEAVSPYGPPPFAPPSRRSKVYDVSQFDAFMKQNPDIKFVYVQWLDYLATMRSRILPIKEFTRIVYEGQRISISQKETGVPQDTSTGQICIEPDLRSLRQAHDKDPLQAATVMSYWRSADGSPLLSCPRYNLETQIRQLQHNHHTTLEISFEIHATFTTEPPNTTLTPTQWLQTPLPAQIATTLSTLSIDLQHFHTPTPGTCTFLLTPSPPLLAADTLLQTHQVIAQTAAQHNLHTTFSTSSAHIAVYPPPSASLFFAGVTAHLPALCAFTLSEQSRDNTDTEQADRQNQTAHTSPLQLTEGGWTMCAANGWKGVYLALSGVLAAGMLGLSGSMSISTSTPTPPSGLASAPDEHTQERTDGDAHRAARLLPLSLSEARDALRADAALREALGDAVVGGFVGLRRE